MSDSLPDVLDPTQRKTRKRRSAADRKAELLARLEKIEAAENRARVAEALKSGQVSDPERAKDLGKKIRALTVAKRTLVDLDLVDEGEIANLISDLTDELESLVEA